MGRGPALAVDGGVARHVRPRVHEDPERVALAFVMASRETEWEKTRIPLAMLWFFALIALLFVMYVIDTTAAEPIVHLERPFTWVWLGL